MNRIEIAGSNNTPHILLDVDSSSVLIEGRSFPEDSKEFYRPIMEWMDELIAANPKEVTVSINLFYLSSSSIISVKQLLMKVIEISNKGAKSKIVWSYDEDDDDIKKTGEDYQKLTKLNFEYKINE